jgi:hypothetical protein
VVFAKNKHKGVFFMKKEKTIARPGDKLPRRIWFNLFLFNLIGGIAWNLENMYFNKVGKK